MQSYFHMRAKMLHKLRLLCQSNIKCPSLNLDLDQRYLEKNYKISQKFNKKSQKFKVGHAPITVPIKHKKSIIKSGLSPKIPEKLKKKTVQNLIKGVKNWKLDKLQKLCYIKIRSLSLNPDLEQRVLVYTSG